MTRTVSWVCALSIASVLLWQLYVHSGLGDANAPAAKSSVTAHDAQRSHDARNAHPSAYAPKSDTHVSPVPSSKSPLDGNRARSARQKLLEPVAVDVAASQPATRSPRVVGEASALATPRREKSNQPSARVDSAAPATPASESEIRRPEVLLLTAIGQRSQAARSASSVSPEDVAVEFEVTGPELGSPRTAFRDRSSPLSRRPSTEGSGTTDAATITPEKSAADDRRAGQLANLPEGFPDMESLVDDGEDSAASDADLPDGSQPASPLADADEPESESDAETSKTRDLSPELVALRDDIRRCLGHYYVRPERAAERDPWGVMHALIAYGVDTELYANNGKVNAIGWLCWNGQCRGMQLLYIDNGRVNARQGVGLQGHPGQFLAMLAQSRVPTDFSLRVDGRDFTVADLIETEKHTCRSGTELTFKLISLAHYLDTEATWKDERGNEWSIPRLIHEELAQPVVEGACGGTHRMMGFSYAVRKREKSGLPFEGEWERARKFVDDYHRYTLALQNPDGSMSTNWYRGRGDSGDEERRLETTGHMVEWLAYSLPEEELTDPRFVKSMRYLTHLLWQGRNRNWKIGPKGHALHALVLYDQRVFGAEPGQGGPQFVESPATAKAPSTAERQ